MLRFLSLSILFAMAMTVVASSANAQFLSERLVPPQSVTPPPVPMVSQPTEPKVFGAERPRFHLWALPFSQFSGSSIALDTEKRTASWQRPVWDVPLIASEEVPVTPFSPVQPTAGRALAASADPTRSPALARFPMPLELLPVASDDPTSLPAFAVLTAAVPLATPNSIPLLRLSIPDPFEQIRAIRLASPPTDADDSATNVERPPLAKLPMVEPPKAAQP